MPPVQLRLKAGKASRVVVTTDDTDVDPGAVVALQTITVPDTVAAQLLAETPDDWTVITGTVPPGPPAAPVYDLVEVERGIAVA
jgi:hypothetical protein